MGSGIACHFANIGMEVLLLDIVPDKLSEKEQQAGFTPDDKQVRNRIVNNSLQNALKSKPSPIYHKEFAKRIKTGNIEDDIHLLAEADWIIEVVVERLEVKQKILDLTEKHRKIGSLVTSNTSGIPIYLMSKGRSKDFQEHFCGTHFFNPPRYLRLFEIIPGPETSPEVIDFLKDFGEKYLGKKAVIAKDTPAFIGNRIGIFSIMSLFHDLEKMGLTIEEIDKLTGPVIGRPKSATFRTVDLVGLDTLVHVANGLYANLPQDERHKVFSLPIFIQQMLDNNWLGSKTGQGFYKKIKNKKGESEIKTLDLSTMDYRKRKKASFPVLKKTKSIENVENRFAVLIAAKDKAGAFYRKHFGALFAYVSHRITEIADDLYKIDDAMKSGFGWEHGPFQIWDAIGVEKGLELIKKEGFQAAAWVNKMIEKGITGFYSIREGKTFYYDLSSEEMQKIPGQDSYLLLDNIRDNNILFQNDGLILENLGDGILNVEFRSKMNSINGDVLDGLNRALDLAEKEYNGMVVVNNGQNFSVGADIGMIFMMAAEQEYEELDKAIQYFQNTMMRMRYSTIPTVVGPHNMTLGGGCELSLHADKIVASAETYIGLVEFGVGLIPGGGGSKEMTKRVSDSLIKGDVALNRLREAFLSIGMARVSTSAYEAFDLNILQKGKDIVVVNRDAHLKLAKKHAMLMAENAYVKPLKTKNIKVFGKQALGMFMVGSDSMQAGNFISEHDQKIANKLAWVMSGGDLSEPTFVSEQYLLDLEREAFLSLCGERKTLERLEFMLKNGKALRN